MKKLLLVALLLMASSANAEMLLDVSLDTEVAITSNVAYYELTAESFTFETKEPNQEVTFSIHIPLTVHQGSVGYDNGAFRVYLDGTARDAGGGKQWNGYLIGNGGAWCFQSGLPTDGRLSVVRKLVIQQPGTHTLRTQYAGSKSYTIGTLRSRRNYQIW